MSAARLADPIPTQELVLQKVRKGLSFVVGDNLLESMRIREELAPYVAGKIVSATFDVLADKIAEDTYTTYFDWKTPKTAWQLFKKQHAPKWFKRRWPVEYENHRYKRIVKLTRMAEYPKANVAVPKDNDRLFVQMLGGLEVIRDKVEDVN